MNWLKKKKTIYTTNIDFNKAANILLCSDKNVIHGLGISIISILENISIPCVIHIAFNGELPVEEEVRFTELAQRYNTSLYFYWIDDREIKTLRSNSFITETTYYRLLVPYVMNDLSIKKCLYLDTDIICVNNITSWYNQELNQYIAAVSKDATSTPFFRENHTCKSLGMKGTNYFNAGVMLINVSQYVSFDIGRKAIYLCSEHNYDAMDQDVLNILLEGKVRFDDSYAYNCGMSVRNCELPPEIYFVHFTGAKKPWKVCTSKIDEHTLSLGDASSWRYRYYKIWRLYNEASPWKEVPFSLPKNATEWRYLSFLYLKNGKIIKSIKSYFKYLRYKINI